MDIKFVKECSGCKKEYDLDRFIHSRTHKECNTCANCRTKDRKCRDNVNSRYFKLKMHYIKLKESLPPCVVCGDNNTSHKEFNHIDPEGKTDIELKKKGIVSHCKTIDSMNEEASKCESVCRKCHTKITQKQLDENKTINKTKRLKRLNSIRDRVNRIKIDIGGCQNKCGDIFDQSNISFYEFDHIDRTTKINNISSMIRNGNSIENIEKEIQKCQLLCGYCHLKKSMDEHNRNFQTNVLDKKIDTIKSRKITQENVDEMRRIWSTDFSVQQSDLAKKYNIPRPYVCNILNNKLWISSTYTPIKNRPVKNLSKRKLSDDDIVKILKLREQNYIYKDIANMFNCSPSRIGEICRNGGRK